MAGFKNIGAMIDAELNGQCRYSTWRKSPTQTTGSGIWFDLCLSPGNPVPNYYAAAPGVAIRLAQSTDGGLYHSGPVSGLGMTKHLRKLTAMTLTGTAVPLPMMLLDYLLFYPFLDESVTDPQMLDNAVGLSRYASGAGVQMMAVVVAGQTGGQSFQVSYTNSAGVSGRTSKTVTMNTQAVNGTIITTNPATAGCAGPFIPLQVGDSGVQSIQSVTFNGPDVGLITLVLVKPIASMTIRGIDAPVEVDFFRDFGACPQIVDDAYLNFICLPSGTLAAAPIHGDILTVWN